jgi:hypothetical protein
MFEAGKDIADRLIGYRAKLGELAYRRLQLMREMDGVDSAIKQAEGIVLTLQIDQAALTRQQIETAANQSKPPAPAAGAETEHKE